MKRDMGAAATAVAPPACEVSVFHRHFVFFHNSKRNPDWNDFSWRRERQRPSLNIERLRSLFEIFPRWNSRVRSRDDNEGLLVDKLV